MAAETEKASSMERAIAALERLASTPNAAKLTVKEQLAEPAMWAAIQKAKMARHDTAAIATVLKAEGIDVKPNTLAVYLREIEREKKGGDDGKPKRKKTEAKAEGTGSAKGSPSTDAGTGGGTQGDKGSGNAPNATGTQPATGKTLTQKPGMGGAFGTDEL